MNTGGSQIARAFSMLLIMLLGVSAIVLSDYEYDGCVTTYDLEIMGNHVIRFCGREYNEAADESTWYYSVTSGHSPAISHWTLALCPAHVVSDAGPGVWEEGTDPTLGITGIKWERGHEDGETVNYEVTLEGNWVVEDVQVGIKAGNDNYKTGYYILGPSCSPYEPPEIEVTVSGLDNLEVTQPLIGAWSGNPEQMMQSLGNLLVAVVANVAYDAYIYYSLIPTPSPSFSGDPLAFEYPTGTWTTIPSWPSMAALPGLSGTATRSYPVAVDLTLLGDRTAGESFSFTIHVVISE